MRYIRYLILAIIGIALVFLAMANRQFVTVRLFPGELVPELPGALQTYADLQISIPMFVVILGGIVVGLLIGFVWEYAREAAVRSEAAVKGREVRRLQRENKRLRVQKTENQGDEVLAILDEAR